MEATVVAAATLVADATNQETKNPPHAVEMSTR